MTTPIGKVLVNKRGTAVWNGSVWVYGKERSWVAPEYRDDPKYAAFVRQVARFRGEA